VTSSPARDHKGLLGSWSDARSRREKVLFQSTGQWNNLPPPRTPPAPSARTVDPMADGTRGASVNLPATWRHSPPRPHHPLITSRYSAPRMSDYCVGFEAGLGGFATGNATRRGGALLRVPVRAASSPAATEIFCTGWVVTNPLAPLGATTASQGRPRGGRAAARGGRLAH
jgi:hypothetical protein